MKARLITIIKQYQPFPPRSEERIRLLRAFNAFRKQIDQLTIPPREEFAKRLMADPAVVLEAGDWDVMLGDSGSFGTLHDQQVHTGSKGLNITEIPEDATDKEVQTSLKNLDASREIIRQRRRILAEGAMTIGKFAENRGLENLSDVGAESKSVVLRDKLRAESISNLTEAQAQLMKLM